MSFPSGYDACPGCGGRKRVVSKSCHSCRHAAALAKAKTENRYITIPGVRIREHRAVAAKMLGRPLRPGEVVHHRNGLKWDNRPENLEVFASNVDHMALHLIKVHDEVLRPLVEARLTYAEIRRIVGVQVNRRVYAMRKEMGIARGKGRRI